MHPLECLSSLYFLYCLLVLKHIKCLITVASPPFSPFFFVRPILSLLDVQTLLKFGVSFSSVSFTLVSVVLHFSVIVPRMSSKPHSANNIAHTRRIVQQLRLEASIDRIKVQCNNNHANTTTDLHCHFCTKSSPMSLLHQGQHFSPALVSISPDVFITSRFADSLAYFKHFSNASLRSTNKVYYFYLYIINVSVCWKLCSEGRAGRPPTGELVVGSMALPVPMPWYCTCIVKCFKWFKRLEQIWAHTHF